MTDQSPHADDVKAHTVARIDTAAKELGPRALGILASIAERLAMGAKTYGGDFDDKPRDWLAETVEEQLDSVVYLTMALTKVRERAEADRLRQRAATRDKYLLGDAQHIPEMGTPAWRSLDQLAPVVAPPPQPNAVLVDDSGQAHPLRVRF